MGNKVQEYQRVARRYAEAILDLAVQQNAVNEVEKDLRQITHIIQDSRDFWLLLIDQTQQRTTQQRILTAIADKAGFHILTKNFLAVLASKRRLAGLDDIIQAFHQLNAKRQGIKEAEIYTARPLPAAVKAKLATTLENIMQSKVQIAEHVLPRVLGGLQVRMGSWMLDDTVEGKIQRLEQQLKNMPAGTDKKAA